MSRKASPRERTVHRARIVLGDPRMLAFLRALSRERDVLACRLITEGLDRGESLDEIFYTGEPSGFTLAARVVGERDFEIEFGCIAGPDAGDGGQWTVRFDGEGLVVEISATEVWIA